MCEGQSAEELSLACVLSALTTDDLVFTTQCEEFHSKRL